VAGSRRWLVLLVAAVASLAVGAGAVAAVTLLTRDDGRDSALDVAVGTAGLVNGVSSLLGQLESPLVALNPRRRQRILRRLAEEERTATRLIGAARADVTGDERTRRRLIEANKEIRRVARRVRRVARRPRARLPGEADRGRRRLEVVRVEVERLYQHLGGDEGDPSPTRRPDSARLSRSAVDLPHTNMVVRGKEAGDLAGSSVARAGDFNGDDRDDVVVAAPGARAAYVVFGGTNSNELELDKMDSSEGFAVRSLPVPEPSSAFEDDTDDLLGRIDHLKVGGAGDLNGDGLADIAVGAPEASPGGLEAAGSVYVVYGSRNPRDVDAEELQDGGFRIDGPDPFWRVGEAIAGDGDLNGDGREDLVVGGRKHVGTEDITAAQGEAVAWAILGREDRPDVVSLTRRNAPDHGWRVKGIGSSLALAGDVNGDEIDDLVGGDAYNRMGAPGHAAIVMGRRERSESVDATRAQAGVATLSAGRGRQIGGAVAGVSDQNGDELADVAVLSRDLDGGARVHVVFGGSRPASVQLDRLGSAGAELDLGRAEDDDAWSLNGVAGAGDVDGDGRQDILVASPPPPGPGTAYPGGARIVLGGLRPGARVRTDEAREGIVPILGYGVRLTTSEIFKAGGVGHALAGVGDMDGDGIDDVAVGVPRADTLDPPDGDAVPAEGATFISYRSPPPQGRGPLEGLITAQGLGKITVGTVVERAEGLLGSVAGLLNGSCGSISSEDARIGFLTDRGTIARVQVSGPGYRTAAGIQVGDAESTVRAAYGARLRSAQREYVPAGRHLSVSSDGGKTKIVFDTDGQKVDTIFAGRTPEVDFVEGCA